jgi:hypothetical protein
MIEMLLGHDQDVFTVMLSLSDCAIIFSVWVCANNENDAMRIEGEWLKWVTFLEKR